MAPAHVTDARSNPKDQIAHAAEILGKSTHRKSVFKAIYRGQKRFKSVSELMRAAKLPRNRALDAAKALLDNGIVTQGPKGNGESTYGKDSFYRQHRTKILSLAGNPQKLKAFPTKTNPKIIVRTPKVSYPRGYFVQAQPITIDDIDSFRKVRNVRAAAVQVTPMKEAVFKKGFQKVIGEKGNFQDWGGEKNDLYTTRLQIGGKRIASAIAFKGPGKKGKLTPKMMGKNGDQVQRLYSTTTAELYLVQYWNQIDESIVEQMKMMAVSKSALERKKVRYGVIDGVDSARLIRAYPKAFK